MTTRQVVLLDGGMGQELVRRSGKAPTPLWSTQVLLDQPELVRDLHIDFIRAGARVITLNTYTATPNRLARDSDAALFKPLQQSAINLAHEARDRAGVEGVRIAGCLPPLVASYRPDVAPSYDECLSNYRHIVDTQADHVDCFMGETMASVNEAKACATAAKASGKPVWIGLTIADDETGRLRSGEPLVDAIETLNSIGVDAALINCSQPESISASWAQLATHRGPVGAYANAFTSISALDPGGTVAALEARRDLDPQAYATFALDWVEKGAQLIGGCCEVGPAHIASLASALTQRGVTITGDLVATLPKAPAYA
ncbi:MAG: homocysteine S-methyltransferase family protein [Pseudomonadota bacterium]